MSPSKQFLIFLTLIISSVVIGVISTNIYYDGDDTVLFIFFFTIPFFTLLGIMLGFPIVAHFSAPSQEPSKTVSKSSEATTQTNYPNDNQKWSRGIKTIRAIIVALFFTVLLWLIIVYAVGVIISK